MIIGREKELELLKKIVNDDRSHFVAVYGRRRVGKTFLIREAFEDLKSLIRNSNEKRKVIFIDELSWMDTKNSDLIRALENFWNGWASARKDIIAYFPRLV